MDGFAVRAEDVPGTLTVVADIAAGAPSGRSLEAGQAMAISTGGVVPDGADAVVPIERVVQMDNSVEIAEAIAARRARAPARRRCRRGSGRRRRGRPARCHAARRARGGGGRARSRARGGRASPCSRPAASSSPPGTPLGPGQVYEANALMLAAALDRAGAEVERLPAVADDEPAHRDAIARGLEADVLVTSGGVSVGPHDLVRRVEAELGVEEVFWQVAVKPGKPVCVRRPRTDARVRAAGQSGVVPRRVRAAREAGAACAAGARRSAAAVRAAAGSRRRCGGTPGATSSCARSRASTATASCSSRSSARSRT